MIEIIPAIDIIDGKCVRLTQGDYDNRKVYNEDPLEVAQMFCDAGCRRLHLVDLDGAKSSHIVNYRTLERIASHTDLTIDFGGGLKSDEDLHIALESGAAMVTGGSIAVKNPQLFHHWLEVYGNERIILGADAKDGKIATSGWTEDSTHELLPFVKEYMQAGIKKVITTDISKDGMLEGPATELYRTMLDELEGIYLIASGGISCLSDIETLWKANVPAVIVGKALYEISIALKDVERINIGKICWQNE